MAPTTGQPDKTASCSTRTGPERSTTMGCRRSKISSQFKVAHLPIVSPLKPGGSGKYMCANTWNLICTRLVTRHGLVEMLTYFVHQRAQSQTPAGPRLEARKHPNIFEVRQHSNQTLTLGACVNVIIQKSIVYEQEARPRPSSAV